MPKKVDEWHQIGYPTTPSQINNFFDLCTKWLVGVPVTVKTTKLVNQNVFFTNEKYETENFTFAENDIHSNHVKKCFYCSSENDIKMMTANPFTRKNKLFVCANCLTQSDLD